MRATILLADYANLTNTGKLNVMGVFRQINARDFPCRHRSLYLVIKLETEILDNTQKERIFRASLKDSESSILHQIEIPFRFPSSRGTLRPEANFILQIPDLTFPNPGEYEWDVFVDDEFISRLEFYLHHQSDPG